MVAPLHTYKTHGSHRSFERDRIRQEDLQLLGIGMTRITDVRLAREPEAVIARLAVLLRRSADRQVS